MGIASSSAESPVLDRWAQIRKNAAERARQRQQEPAPQSTTLDEGNTSGEETIESRVARIKARAAELGVNLAETTSGPRKRRSDDAMGEESIEARVARIKARAAELTANTAATTSRPRRRRSRESL